MAVVAAVIVVADAKVPSFDHRAFRFSVPPIARLSASLRRSLSPITVFSWLIHSELKPPGKVALTLPMLLQELSLASMFCRLIFTASVSGSVMRVSPTALLS